MPQAHEIDDLIEKQIAIIAELQRKVRYDASDDEIQPMAQALADACDALKKLQEIRQAL